VFHELSIRKSRIKIDGREGEFNKRERSSIGKTNWGMEIMVSVIVSRRHDKIQVINEGLLDMTTQGLD
jgi:hypothetical protein